MRKNSVEYLDQYKEYINTWTVDVDKKIKEYLKLKFDKDDEEIKKKQQIELQKQLAHKEAEKAAELKRKEEQFEKLKKELGK